MRTVLSALASQYPATAPPTISFVSINAEELPDISEEYDVSAVPFVVCLRSGQVLESISGSDPIKVRDALERHAGGAPTDGANRSAIPPPLSAVPREDGPVVATQPPVTSGAPAGPAANAIAVPAAPALTPEQSKEALHARLTELVKAAPVMLFMKGTPSSPQCGFSRQLVGILRERSIKYGFFNILADEDVRQGLKEFADWPTFPQLWVDGELVGGLDIVSASNLSNYGEWLLIACLRSVRKSTPIPTSWDSTRSASPRLRRTGPCMIPHDARRLPENLLMINVFPWSAKTFQFDVI
jgi:Grx4 family monothiol glutaredoxin